MARESKKTPEPPKKKPQFAWALLHETKTNQPATSPLPAGRPPRLSPARKSTVHLTSGDEEAIHLWQNVFSEVLGKKVSLGETFGLLARICQERAAMLDLSLNDYHGPDRLVDLIQKLVGESDE